METTQRPERTTTSNALLLVGGVVGIVALGIEAAAIGVVIALVSLVVVAKAPAVYSVAGLHLGMISVVDVPSIGGLVLLEAATVVLLVGDSPHGRRLITGSLVVPLSVVLGVATGTLATARGTPTAAVVVVLLVASGTYLLHRYARVRLGLAAEELNT